MNKTSNLRPGGQVLVESGEYEQATGHLRHAHRIAAKNGAVRSETASPTAARGRGRSTAT